MAHKHLPDRRIDVQIQDVLCDLKEPREIDRSILEELAERPASTGYISTQIEQQAGYVSQRLAELREVGAVVSLDRGYYEIHVRVVNGDG
jgi:predicted Rossmann fold nucleotide-binding protein DprA/Smf involved in DNA uptake